MFDFDLVHLCSITSCAFMSSVSYFVHHIKIIIVFFKLLIFHSILVFNIQIKVPLLLGNLYLAVLVKKLIF